VRVAVVATSIVMACACGPFVVTGCGGATPPPAHPAADAGAAGANDGAANATDGLASLDALAARGATDAPLMREALRVEHATPRSPEVRAERDLCVRATFAASGPVRAWFADQAGAARGDVATGVSGVVPPRGPACVKKGESVHLVIEGEAPASSALAARAVVFAAP
jgi:hypothetical protein